MVCSWCVALNAFLYLRFPGSAMLFVRHAMLTGWPCARRCLLLYCRLLGSAKLSCPCDGATQLCVVATSPNICRCTPCSSCFILPERFMGWSDTNELLMVACQSASLLWGLVSGVREFWLPEDVRVSARKAFLGNCWSCGPFM